jgi:hypothetical protein
MLRLVALLVSSLVLAALLPALASASLEEEWNSAVASLEAVDPSIETPSLVPETAQVVGGGKAIQNGFPAFAVSARGDELQATGQMTLIGGFGNNFKADVLCLGAVTFPDGGGFAHVVGRLRELASGLYPTLEFFVTDSGQPGGAGDEWNADFRPEPPEDVPCTPAPGVAPIASGNILIKPRG